MFVTSNNFNKKKRKFQKNKFIDEFNLFVKMLTVRIKKNITLNLSFTFNKSNYKKIKKLSKHLKINYFIKTKNVIKLF